MRWCTVHWIRLLLKMAMLGQFLWVPWNFEIFNDRLGPGRWNWGNHVTAWNLVFAFSDLGRPRVLSFSECFVKVKHSIGHISGMVDPIGMKQNGSASVEYWVNHVTLTFDMTLTLNFSGSKFKIYPCQELFVRLMCNEIGSTSSGYWAKYVAFPFDHTHSLVLDFSRSNLK